MRVAMMGTFPIRELAHSLGIERPPAQTSSWNPNLASALAEIPGLDVHFITVHPSIPEDAELPWGRATVHLLSLPRGVRLLTGYHASRLVLQRRLERLRPDVVHGHGTEHEYAFAAAKSGFPWVATLHNYIPLLRAASRWSGRPRLALLRVLERAVLSSAEHIICTTNFLADEIRHETRAEVHVIGNIVSDHFFRVGAERHAWEPTVLFVGYFRREKDVLTLVRAFAALRKALPEARLDLVGAPVQSDLRYLKEINDEIDSLRLREVVRFRGLLGQHEVARAMAKAGVVALPSTSEPFGLVLAEALATGTPVVATRVGGVPSVVPHGECGFLVDAGDVAGFAQALVGVLADTTARMRLGVAARDHARRQFGAAEIAARTHAVYQAVLRSSGPDSHRRAEARNSGLTPK